MRIYVFPLFILVLFILALYFGTARIPEIQIFLRPPVPIPDVVDIRFCDDEQAANVPQIRTPFRSLKAYTCQWLRQGLL